MARLRHSSGAVVEVPDEKADGLLARGFTAESDKKPAPRKAAAKSKSE